MAPKVPVAPRPDLCDLGRRCHPGGKGLKVFGTKFSADFVRFLSSSSVLIGGPDVFHNDVFTLVASGTLVHDNVVLCAAHSIQSMSDKDLRFFFFFECNKTTAPAGNRDQYKAEADFLNCTKLRDTTTPQAKGVKTIERGNPADLDYALVAIEWTVFAGRDATGQKVVQVPRAAAKADISSDKFSGEVILISHPKEQPTQASVGKVTNKTGPHPESGTGTDYGYATFFATDGSSGGGVFNEDGQIVGVLKGRGPSGNAFLNLGQVAARSPKSRIAAWIKTPGVPPVFSGDPTDPVQFLVVP
jgi:trypsin-like peptidase